MAASAPIRAGSGAPPRSFGPAEPGLSIVMPLFNEAGGLTALHQRIAEVAKSLGRISVRLSYHPQVALMESAFVRDYPEEYLAQEYDLLANVLRFQKASLDSAWAGR